MPERVAEQIGVLILLTLLGAGQALASPACDAARDKYEQLRSRSTMDAVQYANSAEAADVRTYCLGQPTQQPQAGGVAAPKAGFGRPKHGRMDPQFSGDKRARAQRQASRHRHAGPRKQQQGVVQQTDPDFGRARLPAR